MSEWTGTARFDRSRRYRYELTRRWGPRPGAVCWVLLNPSTADSRADDPTMRRCRAFARDWGYDEMIVVNIFALRSPDPAALRRSRSPVGPRNDAAIRRAAGRADLVVVGWGRHGRLEARDERVLQLLANHELWSVGANADGTPRHPLYVSGATPLEQYQREGIPA